VVEAAHKHNLMVVGHAFSFQGTIDLFHVGVDGLTHIFFDKPKNDEYISLCKQHNTNVNSTLTTCAPQTREGDEMQRAFAADPFAQKALFDPTPREPLGMSAIKMTVKNAYETIRTL